MKKFVKIVLCLFLLYSLGACGKFGKSQHALEGSWISGECRLDILPDGKTFYQMSPNFSLMMSWTGLDSHRISITHKDGSGYSMSLNSDGTATGQCNLSVVTYTKEMAR